MSINVGQTSPLVLLFFRRFVVKVLRQYKCETKCSNIPQATPSEVRWCTRKGHRAHCAEGSGRSDPCGRPSAAP